MVRDVRAMSNLGFLDHNFDGPTGKPPGFALGRPESRRDLVRRSPANHFTWHHFGLGPSRTTAACSRARYFATAARAVVEVTFSSRFR